MDSHLAVIYFYYDSQTHTEASVDVNNYHTRSERHNSAILLSSSPPFFLSISHLCHCCIIHLSKLGTLVVASATCETHHEILLKEHYTDCFS